MREASYENHQENAINTFVKIAISKKVNKC
jgi:hypothetical protein